MEKFGVRYPLQSKAILAKIAQSCMNKYGSPYFITYLLNSYKEEDIETEVDAISYTFEGKEHKYYPDLKIKRENCIIEVKSPYILAMQFEQNKAKFQGVIAAGFKMRLLIFEGEGDLSPMEDIMIE